MITRVKGTHDYLDLKLFNYLIDITKEHLALYNFSEISTPILEPTELFKRSLGLETDVVSKEMYILPPKSEDGESICLRPEATASTMRAFLNNQVQQTPWKVFSWGSMFRYERPQKGRFREFHQINIEIIGTTGSAQDAFFIATLERLFGKLQLDTYALLINFMGCHDDRQKFKVTLQSFLEKNSSKICALCTIRKDKNPLRVFDCKTESCKKLYETAPKITDALCQLCTIEWQELQAHLQQLSVAYSIMPTLVRGLDYYGKTVFEFVSMELGAQNSFCGGGRYNSLAQELGAPTDQPSIGAAIGIERMLLMLEKPTALALPQPPRLHALIPLESAQVALALQVADTLTAHGLATELIVEDVSLKAKMRHANKIGARYAILIGPDELASGSASVKDMISGDAQTIKQRELVNFLTQRA